ncbi:hypothetical protein J6590_008392 [Homalodisca vitripennis]|nr:hypothetical protein J6590_008392 [Homalodisca vitripennis]
MVRFCRIIGGLPIECTLGIRGVKTLKFSITGFLWSSTLLALQEVFSSIILYSYFMDRLNDLDLNPLSRITDFALTLRIVTLQVMVAVACFSNLRKYPRLINMLDTLDRVCQALQHKTSEVKANVKLWGVFVFVAASLTIFSRMSPMIHDGVTVGRALSPVIRVFCLILLYCPQAALFVQFTFVAQIIARSFRIVNDMIEKEITSIVIERRVTNYTLPKVDDTHSTRTVFSAIKTLRTLMNTYWMLCDAVHQANDFYCYQLMAVIFSSLVHVTITCYYFFSYVRVGDVFAMTNEVAWILTHTYYVVVLVNSATDVTNSVNLI